MLKVPQGMKHLPTQLPVVARFIRRYVQSGEDDRSAAVYGAIYDGFPANPGKPTTCAYWTSKLPTPDLGTLPRDEIRQELAEDNQKLVKQRRDVSFPGAAAAGQQLMKGRGGEWDGKSKHEQTPQSDVEPYIHYQRKRTMIDNSNATHTEIYI